MSAISDLTASVTNLTTATTALTNAVDSELSTGADDAQLVALKTAVDTAVAGVNAQVIRLVPVVASPPAV